MGGAGHLPILNLGLPSADPRAAASRTRKRATWSTGDASSSLFMLLEILKQATNISKFIVLGLHSDLCWLRIKRSSPQMYGAHHLQVLGNNVSANA